MNVPLSESEKNARKVADQYLSVNYPDPHGYGGWDVDSLAKLLLECFDAGATKQRVKTVFGSDMHDNHHTSFTKPTFEVPYPSTETLPSEEKNKP